IQLYEGQATRASKSIPTIEACSLSSGSTAAVNALKEYAETSKAVSVSARGASRSEEHTSELQSRFDLVCRLLLEKKKLGTSCTISSGCTNLDAALRSMPSTLPPPSGQPKQTHALRN